MTDSRPPQFRPKRGETKGSIRFAGALMVALIVLLLWLQRNRFSYILSGIGGVVALGFLMFPGYLVRALKRGRNRNAISILASGHWPFDLPANCAVVTLRSIVVGGAPIMRIVHDKDDHGWQFLAAPGRG